MHSLSEECLNYCLARVADDSIQVSAKFFSDGSAGVLGASSAQDMVSHFVDGCLRLFFVHRAASTPSPRQLDATDRAAVEVAALAMSSHSVHRLLRTTYSALTRTLVAWEERMAFDHTLASDPATFAAWEAVVEHVQVFFDESKRRSEPGSALSRLVALLLSSRGEDRETTEALRVQLGASRHGKWVVAVGSSITFDDLLRETARVRSLGAPCHAFQVGPRSVWIAQMDVGQSRKPMDWLRTVTCGYLVADGLSQVPECIELGRVLYAGMPNTAHGPWGVRDGWLYMVLWAIGDFRGYLVEELFGNQDHIRNRISADLSETALTYLRTGSVSETAQLLFVHRNTVLYRLRQIRQVIAVDWTKPYDAALLLITLNLLEDARGEDSPKHS